MEENKLETKPAVLRATIHITRKNTGKVETYEITGTADPIPDAVPVSTTDGKPKEQQ